MECAWSPCCGSLLAAMKAHAQKEMKRVLRIEGQRNPRRHSILQHSLEQASLLSRKAALGTGDKVRTVDKCKGDFLIMLFITMFHLLFSDHNYSRIPFLHSKPTRRTREIGEPHLTRPASHSGSSVGTLVPSCLQEYQPSLSGK